MDVGGPLNDLDKRICLQRVKLAVLERLRAKALPYSEANSSTREGDDMILIF
jgi:hypothetical protein